MSGITNGGQPYKLSNSEIQTFKDCRRKWWLGYYRRLKPKQQKLTGPLALGSRVHEALDIHYTTGLDLQDAYGQLARAEKQALIDIGFDTSEFETEAELGRIMLEGYEQWSAEEGIDADLDLVSTEEILSMPMLGGTVELQGKLDMRVKRKSDGVRLVRDFKTAAQFGPFLDYAHLNEQALTYLTLEAANRGEGARSDGALFTMLKKVKRTGTAKPPFFLQHEVRHNIFTLRNFWSMLHGVVSDMMNVKRQLDSGVDHHLVAYRTATQDCKWKCQFFSICPMIDDGSAAEDAIAEMYVVADPYDYYKTPEQKGNA